jgi:heat shock protein HslJ
MSKKLEPVRKTSESGLQSAWGSGLKSALCLSDARNFSVWLASTNKLKFTEKKMKKSLLLSIASIALVGILLSACSGGASAPLVGEWRLVSYGPAFSPKPAVGETSINFDADGQLAGNVGCNSFGGEYKVSGTSIEFGSILSTLMTCMDTIGEQESVVFAVFANTASFTLTGDTLTITSADGSMVVVLARK